MTWFMVGAVGIILAAFFLPPEIKFLAETKIRLRSSGIVLYYLCHKTRTRTQHGDRYMSYESDDIYHIPSARWAEVEDEPYYEWGEEPDRDED